MRYSAVSVLALFVGFGMPASAADVPRKPLGQDIHGAVRFESTNEMGPEDRLQAACDEIEELRDSLKGRKLRQDTKSYLADLHDLACGSSYKPRPK